MDKRIKNVARNHFRVKLYAKDIVLDDSTDTIIFNKDKVKSVIFNTESPLVVPDFRIFHNRKFTSVHDGGFLELVKAYFFINGRLSVLALNKMATYLVRKYSVEVNEEVVKTLRNGTTNTFYVDKLLLNHEDVFQYIKSIQTSVVDFSTVFTRNVFVVYSEDTLLGYSMRREISLSYYALARKKAGKELIKATIQELAAQDKIIKITNSRIANKANLSNITVYRKIDDELTSVLIKHNQYRFISTQHSLNKLREFITTDKTGKKVSDVCEMISINLKTYYLFKRIVDTITQEELEKINQLKF